MAAGHSVKAMSIDHKLKEQLLSTAHMAIRYGLRHSPERYEVEHAGLPKELLSPQASFVTLRIDTQLRGCIGNLSPSEALIDSIAHNADSAAFHDPRFSPVTTDELGQLTVHISLLNPSQAIRFDDENDLLSQLRPGIDGLIVKLNHHQATFLPSVWEQLPHPRQFLNQLKIKAGLNEFGVYSPPIMGVRLA